MPARRISQREREIRDAIRAGGYSEYLSVADIMRITGLKRTAADAYVKSLPATTIGRRKRYSAAALARKLSEDTIDGE